MKIKFWVAAIIYIIVGCSGSSDATEPQPMPIYGLAHVSGMNQTGPADSTLPLPLVVNIQGAGAGVKVIWMVQVSLNPYDFNGSLAQSVTTTDASGNTSNVWTLGDDTTQQQEVSVCVAADASATSCQYDTSAAGQGGERDIYFLATAY